MSHEPPPPGTNVVMSENRLEITASFDPASLTGKGAKAFLANVERWARGHVSSRAKKLARRVLDTRDTFLRYEESGGTGLYRADPGRMVQTHLDARGAFVRYLVRMGWAEEKAAAAVWILSTEPDLTTRRARRFLERVRQIEKAPDNYDPEAEHGGQ